MIQDKQAARASYDRISRIYNFLSGSSEKRLIKTAVEHVLKPEPGEIVLEPGFGTGQVLVVLAQKVGESGGVYGIDVSGGMLDAAGRRLSRKCLGGRVELTRGDAAAMPYVNGLFNAVFLSFTLELFPDDEIPVVLAECMRVLKDGGRICAACMSTEGRQGLTSRLYAWSHRKFPDIVDCRPILAGHALEAAGFHVRDRMLVSMWGLPVEIVLGVKQSP